MYDSLDDLWALPRTRDEAIALGSKVYFTGKPCKNGHLAPRGAGSNRACRMCNKINYDEWRKNNPEKSKNASNAWKYKNRDTVCEYRRQNYQENSDYYINKTRAWRANNPTKAREASDRWYRENPHKRSEYEAKRRSRVTASLVELTKKKKEKLEIEAIYAECKVLNKLAGKTAYHVDHIKPLSKGGMHHPSNLQILTAEENIRKNARWLEGTD